MVEGDVAALIALATGARADDVVFDDGRRMAVDLEMIVVPDPDAAEAGPALFTLLQPSLVTRQRQRLHELGIPNPGDPSHLAFAPPLSTS